MTDDRFRLIKKEGLPADRSGEVLARGEMNPDKYRDLYEGKWEPPASARTFADHDAAAAGRLCANRPHVILREDPMFGRRGYAKEIVADPKHGYLVLVIAFTTRRDTYGNWVEPHIPKDAERMYWPPSKVEFAPR